MAERVYSFDETYAAMCIWEEIVNPVMPDAPRPWEPHRDQWWGTAGLRDAVITRLAGPCDQAWDRAQERFIQDLDDKHDDSCEAGGGTGVCTCDAGSAADPGAFDWEFVPVWLRECVDWSDVVAGPRVRYQP